MKVLNRILKTLSIFLAGATLFAACNNGFNTEPKNDKPYIKVGNSTIERSIISAEYELTDFETFKIKAYKTDDTEDTAQLYGQFTSSLALLKAYIALPEPGYWTIILEAAKGETLFKGKDNFYISNGFNNISFNLEPSAYSTKGKGDVNLSFVLTGMPYYVDYDGEVYTELPCGFEFVTESSYLDFTKTLELKLDPESHDEYSANEGLEEYYGDFIATLNATNVPAGTYVINVHLNYDNIRDIKREPVVIRVTDGKATNDSEALVYSFSSGEDSIFEILGDKALYSIDYELNGGSFKADYLEPTYYNVLQDVDITLPTAENLTRTGYNFEGWYKTSTLTGTPVTTIQGNGVDGGDFELYAKWSAIPYTITFDANGGTCDVQSSVKTIEDSFELPVASTSQTGYEFKYWFDTSNNEKIDAFAAGDITRNYSLKAFYGPIVYTITLNLNGGTGDFALTYNRDITEAFTLPVPTPSEPGYEFKYWEDLAHNQYTSFAVGDIKKNYNLTAYYAPIQYTITLNLGNGTGDFETTYSKNITEAFTLPTPTATQAGYVFAYWKDSDNKHYTSFAIGQINQNFELTAVYEPVTYTVTLVKGNGTGDFETTLNGNVTQALTLPAPTATDAGYEFAYWKDSEDNHYTTSIAAGVITANMELTAVYTPIEYTITLDLNGGTGEFGTTYTKTILDSFTLPTPVAADAGYEFKYWKDSENNHYTAFAVGEINQDFDLTAVYGAESFTITLDLNGGSGITDLEITADITTDGQALPVPTAPANYDFDYWVDSSNNHYTQISAGDVTGNMTLTAHYIPTEYTITLNLNGGTYEVSSLTATVESVYVLPTPAKDGCTFDYWLDEDNNQLTQLSAGLITEDTTFTAHYSPITYTISYTANGGTMPSTYAENYTVEDEVTLPVPTKADYDLEGWYTTETFDEDSKVTSIAAGTFGDIELWAKWVLHNYSITYNLNEGTLSGTYDTTFTIEDSVTLPTPTKTDYDFEGWYTTSTFDADTKVTSIAEGTSDNVELWAHWVIFNKWILTEKGDTYYFTESENVWSSNNQEKDSTSATTTWIIWIENETTVQIPWTVNSETKFDMFNVEIDGTLEWDFIESTSRKGQSGSGVSGTIEKLFTAGKHTLTATYVKDSSNSNNGDTATITLNPIE